MSKELLQIQTEIDNPLTGITINGIGRITANVLNPFLSDMIDASKVTTTTYAQLVSDRNAGLLIPGHNYKIAHTTKWIIPNTAIEGSTLYPNTMDLILTAVSDSLLSKYIRIEGFEGTIAEYDIDNVLCEDLATPREGRIDYRWETERNFESFEDWLNIKYRRWETSLGSGIYEVIIDNGFAFQDFAAITNGSNCKIGKNSPNILTNIIVSEFSDVEIGGNCVNIRIYNGAGGNKIGRSCSNIVLKNGASGQKIGDVNTEINISNGSINNTILSNNNNIVIDNNSQDNFIGHHNQNIIINNTSNNNIIGTYSNSGGNSGGTISITNNSNSNTIGNESSYITIDASNNNKLGNNCGAILNPIIITNASNANTILNFGQKITITTSERNHIYDWCTNIVLTANASRNIIYDRVQNVTMNNSSWGNKIGSLCVGISLISNCRNNNIGGESSNIFLEVESSACEIGSYCNGVNITSGSHRTSVGDFCSAISVGNAASYGSYGNIIEDGCTNINIGNTAGVGGCTNNTVSGSCSGVDIANSSSGNKIGYSCSGITIVSGSNNNIIENSCVSISLPLFCSNNHIGSGCSIITLNTAALVAGNNRNKIGNGCSNIVGNLINTEIGSNVSQVSILGNLTNCFIVSNSSLLTFNAALQTDTISNMRIELPANNYPLLDINTGDYTNRVFDMKSPDLSLWSSTVDNAGAIGVAIKLQ